MERNNVYARLLAPAPTPHDEICQCDNTPYKLVSALGFNPVHCLDCNLEIAPETLAFSQSLVDAIANWNGVYYAIDSLWLDSGSYERWAVRELSNIASAVNKRGRQVQESINVVRRCYYWYFQDESAPEYQPVTLCPVCGESLQDYMHGIFQQRICEIDSIVTSGE